MFIRGLEQRRLQHGIGTEVDRVQAVVDWSQEGPHNSILQLGGGLSSWCQDLLELRFFMSYCRKNSVRDKVISNKVDVFREIHSTDRMQSVSKVWPSRVALGEAHTLDRVWAISEGKRWPTLFFYFASFGSKIYTELTIFNIFKCLVALICSHFCVTISIIGL